MGIGRFVRGVLPVPKGVLTAAAGTEATIDAMTTTPACPRSESAFSQSRTHFPGGVNSPVRAFGAVGGTPRFIARADGPFLYDLDGHQLIDYIGSWGPMILGHRPPTVVSAIEGQLSAGTSYGAPSEQETLLAVEIKRRMPAVEKLRFVSSGTEAAMSAIRAARGFTGRPLVVKCAGCYHGHVDALLVSAGSGAATFGQPSSAGVPAGLVAGTLVVPFNDLQAAQTLFEAHPGQIACFAIEPVAGNMGLVPPEPGYLEGLRQLCDAHGTLLLLDEVMTGFRLAPGGAHTRLAIRPDLVCMGKIMGGGLPAAAYGGRADVLACISPDGPVYQAGTLSGNPLAMAAGLATLQQLDDAAYGRLEALSARLEHLLREAMQGVEGVCLQRVGSMLTIFFCAGPVTNFADAQTADTARYGRFFHAMLNRGVYLPPSQFEAWFVSLAHGESELTATAQAAKAAFSES